MDPIKKMTEPLHQAAESEPVRRVLEPLQRAAHSEPARKAGSLLDELRQFAFKGNAIDLAIGVVMGAAFGRIVEALVKGVLMPLVGLLLPGEQGYRDWKWVVGGQEIAYGLVLAEVVNFLIVALFLFLFLVKFLGWLTRVRREERPPPPSKEEELLAEIRDLLKARPPSPGPLPPPS